MVEVADRPVLDTDILIDYLRGGGSGVAVVERLSASLDYRVTAIAAFELGLGASYARDPAPVHALLAVECLPLTRAAGLSAGALLGELRASGRPIEVRDALQAGICLAAGATLVTRNVSHYARVPGLRVRGPADL